MNKKTSKLNFIKVKKKPFCIKGHNQQNAGISLVVQWLRLCASNAGGLGSNLGQGTRSHVL